MQALSTCLEGLERLLVSAALWDSGGLLLPQHAVKEREGPSLQQSPCLACSAFGDGGFSWACDLVNEVKDS